MRDPYSKEIRIWVFPFIIAGIIWAIFNKREHYATGFGIPYYFFM